MSYPHGQSVNDGIPHVYSAVQYQTLIDAVYFIKKCGRGVLVDKADITDAYRNIPIHPYYYSLLGFALDSKILIGFLIEIWGSFMSNNSILFLNDHEAVCFIINSQTSKDANIMVLVRRLVIVQ